MSTSTQYNHFLTGVVHVDCWYSNIIFIYLSAIARKIIAPGFNCILAFTFTITALRKKSELPW